MTSSAIAELGRPSRVACSDLLGDWSLKICNVSSSCANGLAPVDVKSPRLVTARHLKELQMNIAGEINNQVGGRARDGCRDDDPPQNTGKHSLCRVNGCWETKLLSVVFRSDNDAVCGQESPRRLSDDGNLVGEHEEPRVILLLDRPQRLADQRLAI